MSNKTEATFHGNDWDGLPDFSDIALSQSDVETALDTLGGKLDTAALRALDRDQLEAIVTASHAKPGGHTKAESAAVQAYQDARRRIATTGADNAAQGLPVDYGNEPWRTTPVAGALQITQPYVEPNSDDALQQAADADMDQKHRQLIDHGIKSLVTISGRNSAAHGFHDDWPTEEHMVRETAADRAHFARQLSLAIVEKIALQHEELSESLGEIRSGRDPLEIYFVDKKGLIGPAGKEYPEQVYGILAEEDVRAYGSNADLMEPGAIPLLKPEGFLVEQADAIIRIADLAYLVNGRERLVDALAIKHEYNATRPYKHGRKF